MAKDKAKISDFRIQERNANKHTVRGMGMLQHAIANEGWISAITVTADGESIDGSARLEAAYERFGEDVEPIIVRSKGDRPIIHIREDLPDASDPRAKKLSIYANRIAEVDLDYDLEILAELHEEVGLEDMFFADEIEALMGKENQDDETQYQAPENQGDRGATDDIPESSVRMMQLFLDTESHPLFLEMVEALNGIYGTDNPTDCVMAGLRELCENHSVSL